MADVPVGTPIQTPTVQTTGAPSVSQPSWWREILMTIAGGTLAISPFAQEFLPGSWKYTPVVLAGIALLARAAKTKDVVTQPPTP